MKKIPSCVTVTQTPSTGIYGGSTKYKADTPEGLRFIVKLALDESLRIRKSFNDWPAVAKSLRSIKSSDVTPLIEDDPRLRKASVEAAERRRESAKRIRVRLASVEAAITGSDDPAEIAARAYWLGREAERYSVLDFEPFAAEARTVYERRRVKGERNAKRNKQWREAAVEIAKRDGFKSKSDIMHKVLGRDPEINRLKDREIKRVTRGIGKAGWLAVAEASRR